jgi:hypothetical protein
MIDKQARLALRALGLSDSEIDALESTQGQKSHGRWPVKVKANEAGAAHWKGVVIALRKLLQAAYPHLDNDKLRGSFRHVLDQLDSQLSADQATEKWFDPARMLEGV